MVTKAKVISYILRQDFWFLLTLGLGNTKEIYSVGFLELFWNGSYASWVANRVKLLNCKRKMRERPFVNCIHIRQLEASLHLWNKSSNNS